MDDASTLLLVEDNEDDVFIFRRAYQQAQLTCGVQVAADGQAACDYLFGTGRYTDHAQFPRPFLVLLDLKLPLRHGFEVLQAVRSAPNLADVAVVILTSSAESRDIQRARELGACAFFVKPPTPRLLADVVTAVRRRRANPQVAPASVAGDLLRPRPSPVV